MSWPARREMKAPVWLNPTAAPRDNSGTSHSNSSIFSSSSTATSRPVRVRFTPTTVVSEHSTPCDSSPRANLARQPVPAGVDDLTRGATRVRLKPPGILNPTSNPISAAPPPRSGFNTLFRAPTCVQKRLKSVALPNAPANTSSCACAVSDVARNRVIDTAVIRRNNRKTVFNSLPYEG